MSTRFARCKKTFGTVQLSSTNRATRPNDGQWSTCKASQERDDASELLVFSSVPLKKDVRYSDHTRDTSSKCVVLHEPLMLDLG